MDDKVVKALQNKIGTYEAEISELKETLNKKDQEIANLANSRNELSSELEESRSRLSD